MRLFTRPIAPDSYHPPGDAERREVWKKLPEAIAEVLAMFPTSRPLRVMYQDEARFGRISDTRYCWAKKPTRPEVKGMLIYQYTYAYAAVSPQDGRMDSLVLPEVSGRCMQIFLDAVAQRYPDDNIVMMVDGAGWHKSHDLKLPENLRLLFLPPYSPELNPQEHLWDEVTLENNSHTQIKHVNHG